MSNVREAIDLMDTDTDEEEAEPVGRQLRSHGIPRSKRKKYSENEDSSIFRPTSLTAAAAVDPRTHPPSNSIHQTITAPSADSDDLSRFSENESSDDDIQVAAKMKATNISKKNKTKTIDAKNKPRKRNAACDAKKYMVKDKAVPGIIQSKRKKHGTPKVRQESIDSTYASEMFGSRIFIDMKNHSSKRQNSQVDYIDENGVHYELFYSKFISKSKKGCDNEDISECTNVFLFLVHWILFSHITSALQWVKNTINHITLQDLVVATHWQMNCCKLQVSTCHELMHAIR